MTPLWICGCVGLVLTYAAAAFPDDSGSTKKQVKVDEGGPPKKTADSDSRGTSNRRTNADGSTKRQSDKYEVRPQDRATKSVGGGSQRGHAAGRAAKPDLGAVAPQTKPGNAKAVGTYPKSAGGASPGTRSSDNTRSDEGGPPKKQ
jgi:hypothetical protein